jgi:uncharacterized protein GlcG (DUF336 family)
MRRQSALRASAVVAVAISVISFSASADAQPTAGKQAPAAGGCASLPKYAELKTALAAATVAESSGLNNQMWATIVDRDGIVCAVAFSGKSRDSQWPGSRVISSQKANTANAFGLDASSASDGSGQAKGLALSTANLYSAVQPGGSLYGLQFSNPVDTGVAYRGAAANYGMATDAMVGGKIGGVNVFGGGLALFATGQKMVGGVGVSGDTSCADHMIAWRVRNALKLDHMAGVGGVSGDPARPDNIIFDIGANGQSAGGFGHPKCINTGDQTKLPVVIQ